MKVLMMTQYAFPHSGGLSSHISTLKKELERRGNHVDTLSLTSLGVIGLLLIRGPSFILNRIDRGLGFIYRFPATIVLLGFAAFLKDFITRYDLIHCHDVIAYDSTFLCRALLRRKVVLTLHGYLRNEALSQKETGGRYAGAFFFFERMARGAKRQLAADKRIREYLIREVGAGPESVRAYRNFVDTEAFMPPEKSRKEIRESLGIAVGAFVGFCPRRLVAKNGVVFAAKAMACLDDSHLLLIAGTGPEEEEIMKSAGGRVTLLGAVPNEKIREYYWAADYTIIPSITVAGVEEATSISAIESMACGTPVIASAIGGLRELIENEVDGILVPQKDSPVIAAAVRKLQDEPKFAKRCATKGLERAREELSVSAFVDELLKKEYAAVLRP